MATFQQKVQGLLGDPTFNMGIGLLSGGQQPGATFGSAVQHGLQQGQYAQRARDERAYVQQQQQNQIAEAEERQRKLREEQIKQAALEERFKLQAAWLIERAAKYGLTPDQAASYARANPEGVADLIQKEVMPAGKRTPHISEDPAGRAAAISMKREIAAAQGQERAKYRAPDRAEDQHGIFPVSPEEQAVIDSGKPYTYDGRLMLPTDPPKMPQPTATTKADVSLVNNVLNTNEDKYSHLEEGERAIYASHVADLARQVVAKTGMSMAQAVRQITGQLPKSKPAVRPSPAAQPKRTVDYGSL